MSSLVRDLEDSFSRGRCVLDDQCLLDGSKVRPIYGKTLQKKLLGNQWTVFHRSGDTGLSHPDIFLEKGPVTCYSDQCVATELLWRSIAFIRILCALTTLSLRAFMALTLHVLRFHGVRTALSMRLHCADGVLKGQ